MLLESVPNQPPKYCNGEPFHEYNQPSLYTDYISKGQAHAKFSDSVRQLYSIPPALMGHERLITQTVLTNPGPFVEATYRHNLKALNTGRPSQASSSPHPTYSNFTTVNSSSQNAIGSQFSFIRSKG